MIAEKNEKNAVRAGTLYLVATPIGNLSDITERAKKVLGEVDFVAAEDTRNSGKLLHCLGISRPMVSYHQHNAVSAGEQILSRLQAGQSCALVTDAGTPAISDPGELLVKLCAAHGVPVTAIPGACAAVNALALSALSTRRFLFEGFLEGNQNERTRRLSQIAAYPETHILYEAPHRLQKTLALLLEVLGDRRITLCRELTKLNEEILITTVADAIAHYEATEPRGEYVLVIEGCTEAPQKQEFWSEMSLEAHVAYYTAQGMKKTEAVRAVAKDRDLARSDVYDAVMKK